jgi:arabinose-5-phosphate isomerase
MYLCSHLSSAINKALIYANFIYNSPIIFIFFVTAMNNNEIIEEARRVMLAESLALTQTAQALNTSFESAVLAIHSAKGKLIISGVGKSDLVGRKMAGTFTSTGMPAICVHATDALHGDIGIALQGDIALLLSKSGASTEVMALVPALKQRQIPIIAISAYPDSPLAMAADIHIQAVVTDEGSINGLAPMSSTTVTMALGDAIASCLMKLRNFNNQQFAHFHPSGSLGKMMMMSAASLIKRPPPCVFQETKMEEVIIAISKGRTGAVIVIDHHQEVHGIITDGDLRRLLERNAYFSGLLASEVMNPSPAIASEDISAADALKQMESQKISQLILVNADNKVKGLVHLHDILAEGIRV